MIELIASNPPSIILLMITTAWDFTTDKMPAKDITLYAKWTVNSGSNNGSNNGSSKPVTGLYPNLFGLLGLSFISAGITNFKKIIKNNKK